MLVPRSRTLMVCRFWRLWLAGFLSSPAAVPARVKSFAVARMASSFGTRRARAHWRRCCVRSIPMFLYARRLPKRRHGLPRSTPGTATRRLLGNSSPLPWRGNDRGPRSDRFSRGFQRKCQRLLRYARHKRPDQPAQARRNISRQRNHFALHIDSAVPLFHAPPRLHAPQKAALRAGRLLALVGLAGVFHLRNADSRAAAVLSHVRIAKIAHIVLCIQHDGNHLVAPKPQEHKKMVVVMRLDFRPLHIWRVILRVMVVVLYHLQQFLQLRPRNERNAYPMMDHPAGTADFLSVRPRLQPFHFDFATF